MGRWRSLRKDISTFTAKFRVWNPAHLENVEAVEAMVDTSAAFSWISRTRLDRLALTSMRRMPFRTIEGRISERDLAAVCISCDERTAGDMVVMADAGEIEVLGAHSLDGLGVCPDRVLKRLTPALMMALGARA